MVMYWLGFGMRDGVGGKLDVAVEVAWIVGASVGGRLVVVVELVWSVGASVIGAGMVADALLTEGMLQAFKVTIKIARAD